MVCNGLVHVALDRGITSILRLSVLSILDGSVENSSLLVVRAANKVIVDGVLSIQSINIHSLEGCQAILAFDADVGLCADMNNVQVEWEVLKSLGDWGVLLDVNSNKISEHFFYK